MRFAKLLVLVAISMIVPGSLWADSVQWNANGYTFTAWASGATQVSLTVKNGNQSDGYFQGYAMKDIANVALTGASLVSPTNGASVTAHVGFNNGSGNCSGSDPYAFCVDTGLGWLLTAGSSQTFVVNLTGSGLTKLTDLSIWHLQTLVTDRICHAGKTESGCSGANDKDTKTLLAISQTGTVDTPEPASLAMLSFGLLSVGGLVRRRK